MAQKRNPQLIANAKRLRIAGHSFDAIAKELSKKGKGVSKASVIAWLKGPDGRPMPAGGWPAGSVGEQADAPTPPESPSTSRADPAPEPAADPPAASDPTTDAELTPDELRRVLSSEIRRARDAADAARDAGDAAEAKAQAKIAAIFLGHLRQIHTRADEDTDTIRVKAADMQAAADRAVAGLHSLAERVVAEVQTWPTCSTCGAHRGAFASADVSPLRAMFERVVRGV
jgi:hypothetical protein